jgi:hypothetical protein
VPVPTEAARHVAEDMRRWNALNASLVIDRHLSVSDGVDAALGTGLVLVRGAAADADPAGPCRLSDQHAAAKAMMLGERRSEMCRPSDPCLGRLLDAVRRRKLHRRFSTL